MYIVGLTGGIACGKSTVSQLLSAEDGLEIIDADLIAREIVQPGEQAYNAIVAHFHPLIPELILEDKSLSRPALGAFVFAHKDQLKVLNGITHPAVRKRIMARIVMGYFKRVVILDVPLLFESGLDQLCSSVITVACDPRTQMKRLLDRNPEMGEEQAQQRINSQMSDEERAARSNYIIDNSGALDDLKRSVALVVSQVKPGVFSYLLSIFPPTALVIFLVSFIRRRAQAQPSKKNS